MICSLCCRNFANDVLLSEIVCYLSLCMCHHQLVAVKPCTEKPMQLQKNISTPTMFQTITKVYLYMYIYYTDKKADTPLANTDIYIQKQKADTPLANTNISRNIAAYTPLCLSCIPMPKKHFQTRKSGHTAPNEIHNNNHENKKQQHHTRKKQT